jgi:DNA-binding LytR/AlgR family response regulator
VFTTAYDNYAIQAFKQNSIDYLLKPINVQDVQMALQKFNKLQKTSNKLVIDNIAAIYRQLNKQFKNRFMVKIGNNIDSIPSSDIHHFDTQSSLSFLVTNKGIRYPIDYSLDQLETMLSPDDFFRINRKTILHIQSVEKVTGFFNSRLSISSKFLDAELAIVSRERVSDFKRWLDN